MNRKLTKRLEMAAGVVEFQRSNPFTERSQVAIAAQFAKKLEEANALAQAEHRELHAARAAVKDAQDLRRGLDAHLLPSAARIGAFALRGDAQAVSRFVAPAASKTRAAFVTEAASLLAAAREHQDALFRHGFTKSHLNELGARLQQFKNATTEAKNAQQRHREKRAKLTRLLAELSDLLRLLDAFHRVRLERDPELLRVWTALRTVGSPTARNKRGAAPSDVPPQAPTATSPSTPTTSSASGPASAQPNQSPATATAPGTPPTSGDADPPPTQRPSAAA